MTKAIYVDDEHDDNYTTTIKELLEASGVDCELRNPPLDLAEVDEWELDMFIIDFDLASAQVEGKHIGYRGNTLATELRNKKPFCPIVLVSRRNIIRENSPHLTTDRSDVDLILFKNDVLGNEKKISQQILALQDAFAELAQLHEQPYPPWSKVLDKLGSDEDESTKLREAFPPISEEYTDDERNDKRHIWYVPPTIEWIRTVLIGYPGILYDSLHASARLGITKESFLSEEVQRFFAGAEFKGLLAGYAKRWWADRMVSTAKRLMIDTKVDGPVSLRFADAFKETREQKLEPSRCVFDKEPVADQICYILKKPVKRENSIIYYPDSRPSIMDTARVSINAIRDSDDFDDNLVEASSYTTIKEIWKIP